jgi:hypothetical protein
MLYATRAIKEIELFNNAILHEHWVIGRSLIRTFLAIATKDAAISSRALSKLGTKS